MFEMKICQEQKRTDRNLIKAPLGEEYPPPTPPAVTDKHLPLKIFCSIIFLLTDGCTPHQRWNF